MGRGIFVKQNGNWVAVANPVTNVDGTWSNVKAGFVNQNGTWKQFYPPNIQNAKVLIVGGGAGGGVGYGNEGGGGGGAGGVVYKENVTLSLSAGSAYPIVVGSGGSAAGLGSVSVSLGTRGYSYQDFANETGYSLSDVQTVAAGYTSSNPLGQFYPTYDAKNQAGSWGGFINTYGVWTNPDAHTPLNGVTVTSYFFVNLPYTGSYTVRMAADNWMSFNINGQTIAAMEGFGGSNDYGFSAQGGPALITINARNYANNYDGNPAGFAAVILNSSGGAIWSTQPGGKTFYGLNRKPEFDGLKWWCSQFNSTLGRNTTRLYQAMFDTVVAQGYTSKDFRNAAFGPGSGIAFDAGSYRGDILDKPDISLGFRQGGGVAGNGNNSSALGYTAFGGGSGGWGVPEITASAGGSGGGSCGLANGAGAGSAGQGYPGGQSSTNSGGGGGGGASGAGTPGGSAGGSGGNGIQLLGYSVGGGGAGGLGSSSWGGASTPGGSGGGGAGNGGNATPGTGGGGGGGKNNAATTGGTGGSGIVVIQYPAPAPLFNGGSITNSNGVITHVFTSTGVLSAI